jgi:hypothetical protein
LNVKDKRQVLLAIGLVCLALFGAGIAYWVAVGQHHVLCPGGKTPIAQQDDGMGQVSYLCPGGQTVTGSVLP